MQVKHFGYIDKDGNLMFPPFSNDELLPLKERNVFVVVSEEKPTRSNEQLKYWFGVVLKYIVNYVRETQGTNSTVNEWHEYYIQKGYFGEYHKEMNGEIIVFKNRSAKTNTEQFAQVVDKVKMEWAERGLLIPDPNQTEFLVEQ